ncbi:MAG TPA: hypothetical protein VFG83_07305 [Kofleriaceae bacterium]|nr:hypothetical protein [Kofleriaceae bacterium]
MLVALDGQLLSEAAECGLRSRCGDCLFFVATENRCGHGWPSQKQRLSLAERARASDRDAVFCKEFELR